LDVTGACDIKEGCPFMDNERAPMLAPGKVRKRQLLVGDAEGACRRHKVGKDASFSRKPGILLIGWKIILWGAFPPRG
jgi:hypothetical protein